MGLPSSIGEHHEIADAIVDRALRRLDRAVVVEVHLGADDLVEAEAVDPARGETGVAVLFDRLPAAPHRRVLLAGDRARDPAVQGIVVVARELADTLFRDPHEAIVEVVLVMHRPLGDQIAIGVPGEGLAVGESGAIPARAVRGQEGHGFEDARLLLGLEDHVIRGSVVEAEAGLDGLEDGGRGNGVVATAVAARSVSSVSSSRPASSWR